MCKIEINGKKFDLACHDHLAIGKSIELLMYKCDILIKGAEAIKEDAKEFKKWLAKHRQNLLDSTIINKNGEVKK